jgi:hypothetical protein
VRIANIVVAHKNPKQVLRLMKQYDARHFHHFVHLDVRCPYAGEFNELPHVTLMPIRRRLVYAGYGFVQVVLDAFALAKAKEPFQYFNVMSGQDYPVKSTQAFYEFLKASYGTEFFEIYDMPSWPQAYHRYERYHLIEWEIKGRYRLENLINRFIPKRGFFPGLEPFGRSAWFTATDRFVDHAVAFIENNPQFIRHMKTVWSPDEFIFNTLAMNSYLREKVTFNNLRHIDWSEGNVTPKIFKTEDLPVLLESPAFLARKFDDTVDETILDLLDQSNRAWDNSKKQTIA